MLFFGGLGLFQNALFSRLAAYRPRAREDRQLEEYGFQPRGQQPQQQQPQRFEDDDEAEWEKFQKRMNK